MDITIQSLPQLNLEQLIELKSKFEEETEKSKNLLSKVDQQLSTSPADKRALAQEMFQGLIKSLSLSVDQKLQVVDSFPRLDTEQVNSLKNIFDEEEQKWAELRQSYPEDVRKIEQEKGLPTPTQFRNKGDAFAMGEIIEYFLAAVSEL